MKVNYAFLFSIVTLLGCSGSIPVNHFNKAVTYHDRGQYWKAIEEYERAKELNPQDPAPRFNLGVMYQDQGRWEVAEAEYMEILRIKPGYVKAWINLASIYEKKGQPGKAEAFLREAMVHDSHSPLGPCFMGFFLIRQGRWEEARRAFSLALDRDPDWEDAHFGIGLVEEAQGAKQKALASFKRASRCNPLDVEAHLKVAFLSLDLGDKDEAIKRLRRATHLKPTDGDLFVRLGLLLYEEKRWRAAQEAFERALDLGGDPRVCRTALRDIYQRLAEVQIQVLESGEEKP